DDHRPDGCDRRHHRSLRSTAAGTTAPFGATLRGALFLGLQEVVWAKWRRSYAAPALGEDVLRSFLADLRAYRFQLTPFALTRKASPPRVISHPESRNAEQRESAMRGRGR